LLLARLAIEGQWMFELALCLTERIDAMRTNRGRGFALLPELLRLVETQQIRQLDSLTKAHRQKANTYAWPNRSIESIRGQCSMFTTLHGSEFTFADSLGGRLGLQ
jgi:hypothetical protein